MTSRREYVFVSPTGAEFAAEIDAAFRQHQDARPWLTDHLVTAEDDGGLIISFKAIGREQWDTHRRAMKMITTVLWPYREQLPVPVPTWDTLPPHMNRGHQRVRR